MSPVASPAAFPTSWAAAEAEGAAAASQTATRDVTLVSGSGPGVALLPYAVQPGVMGSAVLIVPAVASSRAFTLSVDGLTVSGDAWPPTPLSVRGSAFCAPVCDCVRVGSAACSPLLFAAVVEDPQSSLPYHVWTVCDNWGFVVGPATAPLVVTPLPPLITAVVASALPTDGGSPILLRGVQLGREGVPVFLTLVSGERTLPPVVCTVSDRQPARGITPCLLPHPHQRIQHSHLLLAARFVAIWVL